MIFIRHAIKSLMNRWLTVSLTIAVIALSILLILMVEKVRHGAKTSFINTISNTDLIIGARSGSIQLLLYSVFRMGDAINNMSWKSYLELKEHPDVAWTVPISLGDSHKGFRVMGTTHDYFDRYKYRSGQSLSFREGELTTKLFDAYIGADVAKKLNYKVGQEIIISHGLASFTDHTDRPFKVAGILNKTGTPVDRTVIVSLKAIEAIHINWQTGIQVKSNLTTADLEAMELPPKAITAALVGMKSRLKIFSFQRSVNNYKQEALMAILPGVALQQLWSIVGLGEKALIGVSILVIIIALFSMSAMMLASLSERRREMAILRSLGAPALFISSLFALEALLMTIIAALFAIALLYVLLFIAQPLIDAAYGIYIPISVLSSNELLIIPLVIFAALFVSIIPCYRAYRFSISDGLSIKT